MLKKHNNKMNFYKKLNLKINNQDRKTVSRCQLMCLKKNLMMHFFKSTIMVYTEQAKKWWID